MPEPSLLETLRQEHRLCDPENCMGHGEGGWADCSRKNPQCLCDADWPCPVARYIERSEALAKAVEEMACPVHLGFTPSEWGCKDEECNSARAALAAYREGTE